MVIVAMLFGVLRARVAILRRQWVAMHVVAVALTTSAAVSELASHVASEAGCERSLELWVSFHKSWVYP